MKKKITKQIRICDRCKGEIEKNMYFVCPVCKRECCWDRCKSEWLSKYPDVCKDCIELIAVKERKERYIKSFWRRYHREEEELGKVIKSLSNTTERKKRS